jgi:hypothetical protein
VSPAGVPERKEAARVNVLSLAATEEEAMVETRHILDEEAEARGVAPGWWGVTDSGEFVVGPYPSQAAAALAIAKMGYGDAEQVPDAPES